jgi:hypothetical protein
VPPLNWTPDPMELIHPFEVRHQNSAAGALFTWAAWAVDSLHYLDDIDRAYDASHATIGGHRPDVVDVAHVRWATGTCITALDLCAAGLGRAFCGHSSGHELDLADFALDPKKPTKQRAQRRTRLPRRARYWVDSVCADLYYKQIKSARDWLTHSRITRHFTLAASGLPQRLQLQLEAERLGVRHLVDHARDVGTRHVSALLAMLPEL